MLDKHIVLGYFSFQGRSWLLKMSSYLFIHSTNTYWIPTIILLYTLATRCEEATHWKRPWCLERLKAGEEGDDSGWDGWMASPTWWTWVWVSPGSWWWTGRPGVLPSMGSQRVRHDWATELNWTERGCCAHKNTIYSCLFKINIQFTKDTHLKAKLFFRIKFHLLILFYL